ncbi:MAG TPA: hypothetical protein VGK18_00895 [Propionicimonas sp.]|uniref:hypothetical protein n=1 Tax=Propionicimonas sp. TaxID=1955623 RepID=UPI002F42DD12
MSDEYGVYYRPDLVANRVRRARGMLVSRAVSTVISAGIVAACWYFWPDQFGSWAPWMIGLSVATGLATTVYSLIEFLRVRADAKLAQPGLAIGLNRQGMLIGQRWFPWPEVGSVVLKPGVLGASTSLVTTDRARATGLVPIDYTDTMPATLDAAVRVLSSGRAWVDLSRMD